MRKCVNVDQVKHRCSTSKIKINSEATNNICDSSSDLVESNILKRLYLPSKQFKDEEDADNKTN